MNIRRCAHSDAPAIERLFHEFVSYLRSIGDDTSYRFGAEQYLADGFGPAPAFRGLVAEDDTGTVVGYVLFSPIYDGEYVPGLYVIDLYVQKDFRGRGIGQSLMRAVEDVARAEGRKRLTWAVHRDNTRAIHFYKRIGGIVATDTSTMYLDVSSPAL
jgi:ribosomal protein S18 acetylase RimI-like enzyme